MNKGLHRSLLMCRQPQSTCLVLRRGLARGSKPKPDTTLLFKTDSLDIGRYGLRKVDYSKPPPIWRMPAHPPEPTGWRRYVFPASLALSAWLFGYIYFNQEDDIQEYWRQVDAGHVPMGDDDDEDEDDEDEDDDEEEKAEES